MESLNKAQLIGNMTRAPETKTMESGKKLATFSIATNRTWKDATGQKQNDAEFHNVVAWDKLAELIEKYGEKGQRVYVEGYIKTRSWDGEDGKKNYRTEIIATSWMMLGSRGTVPPPEEPAGSKPAGSEVTSIDEVPF